MRALTAVALVMHIRPYRENSAIVQLFCRDQGRLAAVVRGLRSKRGYQHAALRPFNQVQANLSGKSSLVSATGVELLRRGELTGISLAAGFYVLELLTRLLREHDPHPALFNVTTQILTALEEGHAIAPYLRVFERRLLHELGFGIDFGTDAVGASIDGGKHYTWIETSGFQAADAGSSGAVAGSVLLAIDADDYRLAATRGFARRFFQAQLQPLLGPQPLTSRAMLRIVKPD